MAGPPLLAVFATACLVYSVQAASIKHVLLISVDGLHGLDLSKYIAAHPKSNFASLADNGVRFTRAYTTQPSDSFPGVMALVTGANPVTTGIYYDISYDRTYYNPGSNCKGTPGAVVDYSEAVDYNNSRLDGGKAKGSAIDPALLSKKLVKGKCVPAYPNAFMRVNTIFEVIKAAGGTTAWVDKHPSYQILQGVSGKGVDDLYLPEVASVKKSTVPDYNDYDDTHWHAILNWIEGKAYSGKKSSIFKGKTPTLFGGDLQAVAQAETICGYEGDFGDLKPCFKQAMDHIDTRLGEVVAALKKMGIYRNTLIILSAKHGAAPISTRGLKDFPSLQFTSIPGVPGEPAAATVDDVVLLWLNDQNKAEAVAKALEAQKQNYKIDKVLWGQALIDQFGDPKKNSRTPDVIALPFQGIIWGVSAGTIADHGGFAEDDTHVGLLLSNPHRYKDKLVKSGPVFTTQVAPTILTALGISPNKLDGVRIEGTTPLPTF